MNNIVLYRKYRPQGFAQIIGQQHVVQTLQNAIKAKSVSHAYLFCGPRGSGKTSIARIFAKAINCTTPGVKQEPCNECDSCKEITAGNSLDLLEIDAASHTGVDDIRAIIDGIKFAPIKSKYKIFIIDECHQLSKSAFSALLKTLEEPPAHAIFMLATTEPHKMLPTIISRCQRFDFKRLHLPELIKKLEFIAKEEVVLFEQAALALIAVNARGSFRDAESLLDKCLHMAQKGKTVTAKQIQELLGIVETGQVADFTDIILRNDAKEGIAYINKLAEEGVDIHEFARTLVFYTRQLMLLKINAGLVDGESIGFSNEEMVKLKTQAEKMSEKGIQNMLELFIEAENKTKYATILQLPLELAILDICQSTS